MSDDLRRGLASLSSEQLDRIDLAELEEKRRSFKPLPEAHTRTDVLDAIDARLNKLDPARQRERVRTARGEHDAAVEARGAHDRTVAGIRDSIDAAKTKIAALTEKTKADSASALLSNRTAPDNSSARRKIAREGEKAENGLAALELAEPQRARLENAERQAFADLCDEVHDLIGADALADLQRARKALAALAPALVHLWALDIVRESLIGREMDV